MSTRTYDNEYTHLLKYLHVSTEVFTCTCQWNLPKTPNWFCLLLVPPLRGSINVFQWLPQGLRPGLCRSIALAGLFADGFNFLSFASCVVLLFGVVVGLLVICVCCWICWVMSLFVLVVGFVGGVVVCVYCRICWALSLFAFVVGFIGWCWRECL